MNYLSFLYRWYFVRPVAALFGRRAFVMPLDTLEAEVDAEIEKLFGA